MSLAKPTFNRFSGLLLLNAECVHLCVHEFVWERARTRAEARVMNLLWCFECIFVVEARCFYVLEDCCSLWVESLSGKAAVCHRKACNSTMYMAQLSLPRAPFELAHMRFVYSHLTAADSNIWLVYVAYLLFITQLLLRDEWRSSYSSRKVIYIISYCCLLKWRPWTRHLTLHSIWILFAL